MVSKKTGMIAVKNQNNKLNATRTPSESRICIDYKKLNVVTHMDHFHLPFN